MNFGQQLSQVVNANIERGVAPQEIILVLEVTKVELINTMLATAAMSRASENQDQPGPKLVGLNGEKL